MDTAVRLPGRGLYVFHGDRVWLYTGPRGPASGYPKPITAEFPGAFQRDLDAALVHPNGRLYLFRGGQHLRYDLAARRPEPGFPRPYALDWPGVPGTRIDAALTWDPDVIYLFAGGTYTSFSPRAGRVRPGYPRPIAGNWPGLGSDPVRAAFALPDGRMVIMAGKVPYLLDGEGRASPAADADLPAGLPAGPAPIGSPPVRPGPPRLEAELPGPAAALLRPDGIDIYSGNPLPPWPSVIAAGISFIVHKCSERTRSGTLLPDHQFADRWTQTRANGLIRGAYHYYRHARGADGQAQAVFVAELIRRLGPGDLAPALDFEGDAVVAGSDKPTPAGWRAELGAFLETLETRLGRTPMVYTSGSAWNGHLTSAAAAGPGFADFGVYPLWQKYYTTERQVVGNTDLDNVRHWTPELTRIAANRAEAQYRKRRSSRPYPAPLPPWRDWTLFQYSPYTPSSLLNNPFELAVDFDVYNGSVYGLRGLADLGRAGIAATASGTVAAHCEPDGHVHLLHERSPAAWSDTDLTARALPGPGGDPVLLTDQGSTLLYYRGHDRVLEAAQSARPGGWQITDLSRVAGVTGWHDPRAVLADGQRFVVFAGDDDDWHLLTRSADGRWSAAHLLTEARCGGTGQLPASSGQPAVYLDPGSLSPRVVGRLGPSGDLYELAAGASGWQAANLTRLAPGAPAATYSPAVYPSGAETFVVYRAVGGQLWQIAAGTHRAVNLSTAAAGSTRAAGHPACFALGDEAHVVYRGTDQNIYELYGRGTAWSARRLPCPGPASSDPASVADGRGALAAVRGADGMVRVLRFDGSAWTCADTVRPVVSGSATPVPAPPVPAQPGPRAPGRSLFDVLGADAGQFRQLVARGDERSAVLLGLRYQPEVNALTDLVFFSRHAELGQRRLRPDEAALAREWRTIREQLVAPVVAAHARGGPADFTAARAHEASTAGKIGTALDAAISTAGRTAYGAFTQLGNWTFDDFIRRLTGLEQLAVKDGYTLLPQRVTAFRKVYYDSAGSKRFYPGVPGDGVWNLLIPGAKDTPLPPSWQRAPATAEVETLRQRREQIINGVHVDVGHMFPGLDARGHPTPVNLSFLGFPVVRMRSNLEASSFTGDLGSAAVNYLHGSNRSFRDTAMELDPALLDQMYDAVAGQDMTANADAHLLPLDATRTLAENLCHYYAPATGDWRRRWQGFAAAIGLGTFRPVPDTAGGYLQSVVIGTFSGQSDQWREDMQGEIMNAALAYAAAKGHRLDVVNVIEDPKPGIITPTFWEMYWNASGWVLDEFLRRLKAAVKAELGR